MWKGLCVSQRVYVLFLSCSICHCLLEMEMDLLLTSALHQGSASDLVCQAHLQAGDAAAALRSAQRAVLCRPDSPAAWCDLVAARLARIDAETEGDRRAAALRWLGGAVGRLRRGGGLSQPLGAWISTVDRRVELMAAQG